jgi:TonB family protein
MKYWHTALVCALSCATPATAQDTSIQTEIPDARRVKEQGGSLPSLDSAPSDPGKELLFKRGIQGEVRISGVVDADGSFRQAAIASSSRSDELDRFAMDLLTRAKFTSAKDRNGQPVPARATVPLYFWKDSLTDGSLFSKSCADFVIDADWYATAFPEKKPDDLRSWLMLSGMVFAGQYRQGAKKLRSPEYSTVYAACKAKPSRKFVDTFMEK